MNVNAPDGYYLLVGDDMDAGALPDDHGFGLHPRQNCVIVTTLSLDADKRVFLDAHYWEEGEPVDLLEYWAGTWSHVARAEISATDVVREVGASNKTLDLTPGAGKFGLALFAGRMTPEQWPVKDAREHHKLVCWPLTPGDDRRHRPEPYSRDAQPMTAADESGVASLTAVFVDGTTPLVRTDFADDAAWGRVVAAVMAPADFGGEYVPNVQVVDDRSFEGLDPETLGRTYDEDCVGYVLLADAESMGDRDEITVVYVDLYDDPGRSFRVAASEIASIESNLSIANMDFEDFADNVDSDGVFRGFPNH